MTRGRKPIAPAVQQGEDFASQTPAAIAKPEAHMNLMSASYSDDRDLVNQLLGQAQMASALAKFSATVGVSKLAFIKENKVYQALKGKKNPDGRGFSGTWEDFCELLGTSATKVNEDIENLRIFGEDAMRQLSTVGAGYRDLRKLRALPDDARTGLLESPEAKQALASGDKDALRELIEDLAVANDKLKSNVEELTAEAEAHVKIIAGKDTKINEIDKRLKRAEKRIATLPPDEALAELRAELLGHAIEAEGVLVNKLRPAFEALAGHIAQHGGKSDEYLGGCLGQIEQRLREIREEFGLNQADVAAWANS